MIGPKTTLTLERVTTADDNAGSKTSTWTDVRDVKGVLCTIAGDERLSADKTIVIESHNFYIDYPNGYTITEKDRFYLGTRKFKIIFINDIGASQNKKLKITLKEET